AIAAAQQIDQVGAADRTPPAARQQIGDRRRTRDRLQAAAVAAPAHGALRLDGHVAELAGESAVAEQHAALAHHARADAGGQPQVHHVEALAGGPETPLREDAGVGVVDDPHWQPGALGELVTGPHTDPAGH